MALEHWLLPAAVVLVKFLLKLLIDRHIDLPEFIDGLLSLPFDIAFVCSSLLAGLLILNPSDLEVGLGFFALSLGLGIVSAFLWRRSSEYFVKHRYVLMAMLFMLNICATITASAYVIRLLAKGSLT